MIIHKRIKLCKSEIIFIGKLLKRAVCLHFLNNLIYLGGNIGIFSEAHAVFLGGEGNALSKICIACACARHGVCHGVVYNASLNRAAFNLHKRIRLSGNGSELCAKAQILNCGFACGAGLCRESNICKIA